MVLLSSLYHARNEKYPICYSGILAFVITICLPLNLGISKLPTVDVFVLLVAGFTSLFMLARNEEVGFGLLNHLRIKERKSGFGQTKPSPNNVDGRIQSGKYEESKQDPLILLQHFIERIIITHDEHLDLATRVRLENTHHRIQKITRQLCKLDA